MDATSPNDGMASEPLRLLIVGDKLGAEDALRDSEQRYLALVEMAQDAILVADADNRCIYSNPAGIKLLGAARRSDLIGRSLLGFIPAADRHAAVLEAIRKPAHPGTHSRGADETVKSLNGRLRHVEISGWPITYHGQKATQLVMTDVTERRKLEQQFIQAQKMEAIGLLAGGIAHDFRNQLTVIKGFTEMLIRRKLIDEEGLECTREILAAVDRSATMSEHLLVFTRKHALRPEVLNLNTAIYDMFKSLARMLGEDVKLSLLPSADLGHVKVDRGQFEQALMNLIVNARDAMPQGGDLSIATANVNLSASFVRRHPGATAGAHVMATVTDTGLGMDRETLRHIFEPLFTTKPPGYGTGLGLSMVYGFVKQSGGYIAVDSEPGRGATFTIYLPRVAEEPAPAGAAQTLLTLPTGTATLLLVEDEAAICSVVSQTLRECGFTVLAAANLSEGLQLSERRNWKIDLLICDVVMPGIGGPEVAAAIRQHKPDMPVLYISGYTGKALSNRGVLASEVNLLVKPFSSQTLTETVKKLLEPVS